MVARLFDHLFSMPPDFRGTYVDIGAFDPVEHSTTYLFYRRGWRGLTIEPNPARAARFAKIRPNDIHIVAASGDGVAGEYVEFDEPLLNGFLADHTVKWHLSHGHRVTKRTTVPFVPINDLLAAHTKHVDYLSIDVETMEHEILRTWDFSRWQPRVIVAEIHGANLQAVLDSPVTQLLSGHGYELFSRLWQSSIFVKR